MQQPSPSTLSPMSATKLLQTDYMVWSIFWMELQSIYVRIQVVQIEWLRLVSTKLKGPSKAELIKPLE